MFLGVSCNKWMASYKAMVGIFRLATSYNLEIYWTSRAPILVGIILRDIFQGRRQQHFPVNVPALSVTWEKQNYSLSLHAVTK